MTFFTRDTQVSRVRIESEETSSIILNFLYKSLTQQPDFFYLAPMICPRVEDLSPFYRKFINCLLKHCEIWKKDQLVSTKNCSDISELDDNQRNCSECKKLRSNLWKALTLVNLINFQRKKILYDARKGRLHLKSAKVLRVILGRSLIETRIKERCQNTSLRYTGRNRKIL